MVSAPTNGELTFAIVLPPSASNRPSSKNPETATTGEGRLIGHAGTWHIPRNELVFMIDKPYWEQVYMTEVLAALVPVFWQHRLKKVWADVNLENEASLKVLKKSGFIRVGNNVIESSAGKHESLRMELTNPVGGGEEEEEEEEEEGEGGEKRGWVGCW